MRSPSSLPRSYGPAHHDGWPSPIPPLAGNTAVYLAARMRWADEVAEAAHAQHLAEARIGSSTGGLVIGGVRRAVGARLVRLGQWLRGARPARVGTRSGTPTALGLIVR